VLLTRLIAVANDDDVRTLKARRILVAPLARSSGVAGRDVTECCDRVSVLLAFDDVDRLSALDCCDYFWQALEEPLD
jgi:hypothetical protein